MSITKLSVPVAWGRPASFAFCRTVGVGGIRSSRCSSPSACRAAETRRTSPPATSPRRAACLPWCRGAADQYSRPHRDRRPGGHRGAGSGSELSQRHPAGDLFRRGGQPDGCHEGRPQVSAHRAGGLRQRRPRSGHAGCRHDPGGHVAVAFFYSGATKDTNAAAKLD